MYDTSRVSVIVKPIEYFIVFNVKLTHYETDENLDC